MNGIYLRIDNLQEKCSHNAGCSNNYEEQHFEIFINKNGKIEVYDSNCNSRIEIPEVITIDIYDTI